MLEVLDLHRQAYNVLLAEFTKWDSITKYELQSLLPDLKIADHRFQQVHSKALQMENYRLFSNLKALGESKKKGRKVGKLRFKGKGWFKTITYNQSGFKIINTSKRLQTLRLSKIGNIPIRIHSGKGKNKRIIKGTVKQVTIKREQSGKWYASIVEETKQKPKQAGIKNVVGIDLGLTDTVWDSDNHKITNPRHLQKGSDKLAKLQRKLSRKKKGSNNRAKAKLSVARQHEKVANIRDDFAHKTSRYYVDNYDIIGMEDMQLQAFIKHNRLAKHMLDACWGKLRQYITYKAESAGKVCLLVDHKGTTQRCHNCQTKVEKNLGDRQHTCPSCGIDIPRDYNSALEIKRLTLQKIGQGLPETTPAEMEPTPLQGRVSSKKQEAPCES